MRRIAIALLLACLVPTACLWGRGAGGPPKEGSIVQANGHNGQRPSSLVAGAVAEKQRVATERDQLLRVNQSYVSLAWEQEKMIAVQRKENDDLRERHAALAERVAELTAAGQRHTTEMLSVQTALNHALEENASLKLQLSKATKGAELKIVPKP